MTAVARIQAVVTHGKCVVDSEGCGGGAENCRGSDGCSSRTWWRCIDEGALTMLDFIDRLGSF